MRVVPIVAEKTAAYAVDYTLPVTHIDTIQYYVARLIQGGAFLALLLVSGLAGFNFIEAMHAQMQSVDQEIVEIQQQGERGVADVTYHRTVGGDGMDVVYFVHHFLFRLPHPHGELPPIKIVDREKGFDNVYICRFNYHALADFVLKDCTPVHEKKGRQISRSQESIPCTRTAIPIWFKADHPEAFWLPEFPVITTSRHATDITTSRHATDAWIELLFLAGFFVAGGFVVVIFGGAPLFRLFLGIPLFRLFLGLNAR